jgi:hypothetical protein
MNRTPKTPRDPKSPPVTVNVSHASDQLRSQFDRFLNFGGAKGTAASAGSYDQLVGRGGVKHTK